jgi:hypothetical protein
VCRLSPGPVGVACIPRYIGFLADFGGVGSESANKQSRQEWVINFPSTSHHIASVSWNVLIITCWSTTVEKRGS